MQVQPITNKQHNNLAFNAELKIKGLKKGCYSLTNLLPDGSIDKLQAKAKTIGTDKDTIYACVYPHTERNFSHQRNLLSSKVLNKEEYSKEYYTKVSISHVCPSIGETKLALHEYKYISWLKDLKEGVHGFNRIWTPNRQPVYETISKYMDELKTKFDKK